MDSLAAALRDLHRAGAWIDAFYPLSELDGRERFECRIRNGSLSAWAVNEDPLVALRQAIEALSAVDRFGTVGRG